MENEDILHGSLCLIMLVMFGLIGWHILAA